jgi:monothiol glutaredoxin
MAEDIFQKIRSQIKDHRIVLYMKGTPSLPQCGFSAATVEALGRIGREYVTYNVLEDPALREGVKQYSNWPTIPQLYVDGEFIGGCDIVLSMFESGDLEKLISNGA